MMKKMNNLIAQENEQYSSSNKLMVPQMGKLKDLNEVASEANEIVCSYRASLTMFKNRNSTQNKPVNLESTENIIEKIDQVNNQM